jgi:hypothetical protein
MICSQGETTLTVILKPTKKKKSQKALYPHLNISGDGIHLLTMCIFGTTNLFSSIIYIIRCTIVVDFDHILRQAFFLVALATIRNMDIWYYFRIKLIF